MEDRANLFYSKAVEKLKLANEELCRPQEDVVTPMICQNSRLAIEHYLKGYLVKYGRNPSEGETIESLFEQCKILNPRFESLGLNSLDCYPHKGVTQNCGGASKISKCYEMADSLDTFLRKERILA